MVLYWVVRLGAEGLLLSFVFILSAPSHHFSIRKNEVCSKRCTFSNRPISNEIFLEKVLSFRENSR